MSPDEYAAGIADIVERHGVCVQYVGEGDGEPAYAYTIGLSRVDHPELVIVDLPLTLAHQLLNDLAFAVLRSGMQFEAGDRVHRLISNEPVQLISVTDPSNYIYAANAFRDQDCGTDGANLPALQVAFRDDSGRWPWQVDNPNLLLGPPPIEGHGADVTLPDADTRRAQGG